MPLFHFEKDRIYQRDENVLLSRPSLLCPFCRASRIHLLKDGSLKCAKCQKKISVKDFTSDPKESAMARPGRMAAFILFHVQKLMNCFFYYDPDPSIIERAEMVIGWMKQAEALLEPESQEPKRADEYKLTGYLYYLKGLSQTEIWKEDSIKDQNSAFFYQKAIDFLQEGELLACDEPGLFLLAECLDWINHQIKEEDESKAALITEKICDLLYFLLEKADRNKAAMYRFALRSPLFSLSGWYWDQGEKKLAELYLEKLYLLVLEDKKEKISLEYWNKESNSLFNYAMILYHNGQILQAKEVSEQILDYYARAFQQEPYEERLAELLFQYGIYAKTAWDQGQKDYALQLLERGLKERDKAGLEHNRTIDWNYYFLDRRMVVLLLEQAWMLMETNRDKKARVMLEKAIEQIEKASFWNWLELVEYLYFAFALLARWAQKQSQLEQAIGALEKQLKILSGLLCCQNHPFFDFCYLEARDLHAYAIKALLHQSRLYQKCKQKQRALLAEKKARSILDQNPDLDQERLKGDPEDLSDLVEKLLS